MLATDCLSLQLRSGKVQRCHPPTMTDGTGSTLEVAYPHLLCFTEVEI